MKIQKGIFTLLGFILLLLGMLSLILSMLGLQLTIMQWPDAINGKGLGTVIRIIFIIAGLIVMYLDQTDFDGLD